MAGGTTSYTVSAEMTLQVSADNEGPLQEQCFVPNPGVAVLQLPIYNLLRRVLFPSATGCVRLKSLALDVADIFPGFSKPFFDLIDPLYL